MVRIMIRFLGLILILSIFVITSINSFIYPYPAGAVLAKSNLPLILSWFDILLTGTQYVHLAQGSGAMVFAFSLFILLGVGRTFFSLMLAFHTMLMAILYHVDMKDPIMTSESDRMQIIRYLSHTGALLFVAASRQRYKYISRSPSPVIERSKKER
ncbi:unnamed protein product [Phytomonas sp. Hart1]|nr:unnamed protein product [Phytomonas sp. Hart1]|eukprot:CCW66571.1 unnamed protein product [Phytomonas sp. isolate Hart1]